MTFELVTVGVASYPGQPEWSTGTIESACRDVADTFARHHGVVVDWSDDTGFDSINGRLRAWADRAGLDDATSRIVYWCGHGDAQSDQFWLATTDSVRPLGKVNSAISSADLFDYLSAEALKRAVTGSQAWTLIIVDACGSGPGIRRIRAAFDVNRTARNVGLIGTTDANNVAYAGHFPPVLDLILTELDKEDGDAIRIRELIYRIDSNLGGDRTYYTLDSSATIPKSGAFRPQITAPLDLQREVEEVLADKPDAAIQHFFPKARGAELTELAWHFRGREFERRRVINWLEDQTSGLLVVTGIAGAGKSALLGMILASTDPHLIATLDMLGYHVGGPGLSTEENFDAVIHLSGQTVHDVVDDIAGQLKLSAVADVDELMAQVGELASLHGRLSFLMDALDEARDPFAIGSVIIRRLAALSKVRVLLGTRRSLGEDPDRPEPTPQNLLATLNIADGQTIYLDNDPGAIRQYVEDRLEYAFGNSQPRDRIRSVARRIGDANQPFLFARLAITEIVRDPKWLDPVSRDLQRLIEGGHARIFDNAVQRYRTQRPRVEVLLHALAYARGNGLPRNDGIWATAGSALYNDDLNDTDIRDALSEAAPYIMQDSENGQTVYRLAHRTFIEYYRRQDQARTPRGNGHIA